MNGDHMEMVWGCIDFVNYSSAPSDGNLTGVFMSNDLDFSMCGMTVDETNHTFGTGEFTMPEKIATRECMTSSIDQSSECETAVIESNSTGVWNHFYVSEESACDDGNFDSSTNMCLVWFGEISMNDSEAFQIVNQGESITVMYQYNSTTQSGLLMTKDGPDDHDDMNGHDDDMNGHDDDMGGNGMGMDMGTPEPVDAKDVLKDFDVTNSTYALAQATDNGYSFTANVTEEYMDEDGSSMNVTTTFTFVIDSSFKVNSVSASNVMETITVTMLTDTQVEAYFNTDLSALTTQALPFSVMPMDGNHGDDMDGNHGDEGGVPSPEIMFSMMDLNQDGYVNMTEMTELMSSMSDDGDTSDISVFMSLFNSSDADNDGMLSPGDEFNTFYSSFNNDDDDDGMNPEVAFGIIDTDGDGNISASEFSGWTNNSAQGDSESMSEEDWNSFVIVFETVLDVDGSGGANMTEFTIWMESTSNDDGHDDHDGHGNHNSLDWMISDSDLDLPPIAGDLSDYSAVLSVCTEDMPDSSDGMMDLGGSESSLVCSEFVFIVKLSDAGMDSDIMFHDVDNSGTLTDGDMLHINPNATIEDWTHLRLYSTSADAYSDENPMMAPGFTGALGMLALLGAALLTRRD
jgi:Ca2+-binding EF-hand superfamily protein